MADPSDQAPLVKDRESQHISAAQKGCSTGCTLMIAGLVSLVCVMVCCQILSIYMIFQQKEHIDRIEESKEEIYGRLNQLSQADTRLSMSIIEYQLEQYERSTSKSQLNDTDDVIVETVLRDLLQDLELPQFNGNFSDNLWTLKQQMNESMWKSFETWMQNWLIFQKAHQLTSVTMTKCQKEAKAAVGPYKPQCYSWGAYVPNQCYGSTGYCWCVDHVSGKRIEGTLKHGQPDCWNVGNRRNRDQDYGDMIID